MTDRETLYAFRLKQAEETLTEAERMAAEGFNPRTITNRGVLRDVLCRACAIH